MKSLFSDPEFVKREVKKPRKLMEQLLLQAAIMQDVDYLGISLYDLFTGEEIYAAWEDENFRRYVMFGRFEAFRRSDHRRCQTPCCATSSRRPKR